MTNLSKVLCEICGIEPKVDFEQPENFVKLLKIANNVLGGVHFATEVKNANSVNFN